MSIPRLPHALIRIRDVLRVLELALTMALVVEPVARVHRSIGILLHAMAGALVVLETPFVAPAIFLFVDTSPMKCSIFKTAAVAMAITADKKPMTVHQVVLPLALVVITTREFADPIAMLHPRQPVAIVRRAVGRSQLALAVLHIVLEVSYVLGAIGPLQDALATALALDKGSDVECAIGGSKGTLAIHAVVLELALVHPGSSLEAALAVHHPVFERALVIRTVDAAELAVAVHLAVLPAPGELGAVLGGDGLLPRVKQIDD
mmetsp:Transcript_33932/g.89033  ORF Transcript_33932/g.89033 Transcript_33932/m.89033 type:complete len:262 (+) Transcript_33932:551-1336(+)